ncbi:hypothetical protein HZH66_006764 [Vespula vulgaris]|uniref:Uncharacterized protein n=1 Tax=Vespula vulgaris TaxID=7454 RepID=A0A834N7A0_VESVU|nr:hypothetical protein HZH66_006764 [Vespula vulgaris]
MIYLRTQHPAAAGSSSKQTRYALARVQTRPLSPHPPPPTPTPTSTPTPTPTLSSPPSPLRPHPFPFESLFNGVDARKEDSRVGHSTRDNNSSFVVG